ncbi:cation-translocating P-type ATPase [Nocardioides sp. Soil805]|uniref:cation-translocating P-type ATPase n=1 Tax=Nocardioides sp. Soil805 TaxID=1736416 RepID=UPI00070383CC|nr:HAD-IC family P-type ATPase [Nocardioides sp. Soil805]KRF37045.1 ATPase [Nocardioides sp. Soil805]
MTATERPPAGAPGTAAPQVPWYAQAIDEVAARLEVDPRTGLTQAEAQRRLAETGPNALAAPEAAPVWKRFLAHYREYMQIVLVVAALVSLLIGEYGTAVGLTLLTLFNAWLGYHQEGKAEAAAAALGAMMKAVAKVRRDGDVTEVPAEELVPGDIVLLDAGDRVPADGRVIVAATLQIEEGALTGESVAVEKRTEPVTGPDVAIGDRADMAFMNTNVTRGHGEVLVTTTGMGSEVGHIAHMLAQQKGEKSPLTKQVDRLTIFIIVAALFAFVAILVMGLAQGESFTVLFGIGVALAVGSIPDALPAVVTTILSVGSMNMAQKNAIMKSLPSVETLGSTSAINSDKTGTLTLNQMTVREITTVAHHYTVSGEGYSFEGQVHRTTGDEELDLDYVMFPCALCNDSDIQDGVVVGDPTEGALYVLAQKGGVDVRAFRRNHPRIASVPFDSDYKFMATFHLMTGAGGAPVVRAYVKGAPDVILDRSGSARMSASRSETLTDDMRAAVLAENERIAAQGRRVLAFAQRELDPSTFDPDGDLMALMQDLEMTALVGEVDPPRAEATKAIAQAREAGIRVRMITGDHAITAGAIAAELGIEGRAVTGTEFAAMSDEEAAAEIEGIGVIARVAPEHKVRLVEVLKRNENVVAMTGDGVNDAPAIGAADIGIAMGITGTDVAKGAAKMILADDNFATIVAAVKEGRSVYDNLQKFLRIQIANLFMFILAFLGSTAFAVAGTALLIPSQVLWVHMAVVAPIGAVMGLDVATPGIMRRAPRPFDQPIIVRSMMVRLFVAGAFMAAATLVLVQIGQSRYDSLQVGQSMAIVGLGVMNVALALNLRFPEDSAFGSATLSNPKLLWAFAWAFLGSLLVTETRVLQDLFGTSPLTGSQWAMCLVPGVALLALGELFKLVAGARRHAG